MNYDETISYLFQRLPIYQRTGKLAYKADIGNIVQACNILKNPHLNFKSIHIAGTNGKGSTSHMISSILQEAGYKVGLYTSPHLKDFRERIRINGKMISKDFIIKFIEKNKCDFQDLNMSFFEMTVALAFQYFDKKNVDIAIIETGLGGRLDSTNIIKPLISVITNIGFDHKELLGSTIEEIANEKAGIIKKNTPVIIGRHQKSCSKIFLKRCKELNSEITFCEPINNYQTDLEGDYQKENVNTAICTINMIKKKGFNISKNNISKGLLNVVRNTSLLGRWQILNVKPLTICDIAHNIDGMKEITKQLKKLSYRKLHFILGTVQDKEIDKLLSTLPKDAKYYFCAANIPRSLDKDKLREIAKTHNLLGSSYNNVNHALISAKKNALTKDCIIISGSTFVVAEII